MSDAMANGEFNGQTVLPIAEPHSFSMKPSRSPKPTFQYEQILVHLREGKTITPAEASEEYGCEALSAVVWNLRRRGWSIASERLRNERGERYSKYRLVDEAVQDDGKTEGDGSADGEEGPATSTSASDLPRPYAFPEIAVSEKPLEVPQKGIRAIAVRMGAEGPELQVIPAGSDGSEPFYALSPAQARYLLLNLEMFAR